jgi:hypothetical protein
MKIGPLSLFENHIAAWHWPWSVTWRWLLTIRRHNPAVRLGPFWLPSVKGINTPVFDLCLYTQRNMPKE